MKMLAGLQHGQPVSGVIAHRRLDGDDLNLSMAQQRLPRQKCDPLLADRLLKLRVILADPENAEIGRRPHHLQLALRVGMAEAQKADADPGLLHSAGGCSSSEREKEAS